MRRLKTFCKIQAFQSAIALRISALQFVRIYYQDNRQFLFARIMAEQEPLLHQTVPRLKNDVNFFAICNNSLL